MVKKYQKATRNDTSLLVPYDKTVGDYFIQSHRINGKKNLVGCLTVKGFDLSLLNPEEQQLRLREFQDALRFNNFAITFLKLEQPLNFNNNITYYKQQLKKLNKIYQEKTISQDEFIARKKQIKGLIANLEQDLIMTNDGPKTKKAFYIFVYGKNEAEIQELMQGLENKLNNCNFTCERLNNYQLVNILHLI